MKAAALVAVAAFCLSLWVAANPAPLRGDLWLTLRIQRVDSFADAARLVNAAGDWWWQWLALALLAAAVVGRTAGRLRTEALCTFAAVAALRYWDQLMKAAVQSPRPAETLGVEVDRVRDSYGFPSGHVYSDVLIYGVVAAFAVAAAGSRVGRAIRVVAIATILLAGPARVYVGAHWPSDAVGGYLWGMAALCLAFAFGRWMARRRWRHA